MADNFIKFGTLYPNPNSKFIFGTSVYFPGVSFLSMLFIKIISNRFLIEFLLAIAIFFVFALICIQKHIIKIYFGRVSELKYYLLTALSFFFININWVTYACEFKPDTIAYCIGAFGLIISKVDVKYTPINYIRFIIGVILTGIAIIFKQQYLAFLIGLFFFAVIKNSKRFWMFCILTFIITLIVLYNLVKIPYQRYWNVEILKDDGFLDLITVIKNNSNLIPKVFIYLISIYFLSPFKSLKKINFKYSISNSPWLLILVFILFFSFLS
jgi:type IV secretory pathway VirB3-like protein